MPISLYDGLFHSCYLGLYTAPTPTPTPGLTLAEVYEPLYAGYARQLVNWIASYCSSGQRQTLQAESAIFGPASAGASDLVQGVILTSLAAGGVLYLAAPIQTPVMLRGPPDRVVVQALFWLAAAPFYGGPRLIT